MTKAVAKLFRTSGMALLNVNVPKRPVDEVDVDTIVLWPAFKTSCPTVSVALLLPAVRASVNPSPPAVLLRVTLAVSLIRLTAPD